MSRPVTSIIFDIGKVLVDWDPRYLYEQLIHDEDELNYFLEHVVTLIWHTEHDRGLTMAEGIKNLVAAYPEHAELIKVYDDRWFETLGDPINGMEALVGELDQAGIPLYGLSNFSAEKFSAFAENFPPLKPMRDIIVSGEEGIVKPDPAIFELAITRFSVAPEATLFIDDREDNTEAAKKAGFKTHLFVDAATLRADLVSLNLL